MKLYLMFLIANLIKDGNAKTASQIAQKLEISQRSVLRYISDLEVIGVPVNRVRGRNGGFVIDEKFSLNFSILTNSQRQYLTNLLKEQSCAISKEILSILNLC